jgi:virginiamycin B lyase
MKAVVGLALVCAMLVAACSATPGATVAPTPSTAIEATPVAPTTSPRPTPSGPPTIDSAGATRIHISPGADWLAIADGAVWTAAGRGIVPLDPVTGEPGATTEILGICLAFDVGYDSLWAGGCDDPAIWRIDPATGGVLATIPLAVDGIQEEGSIAAGEGGVWVVSTASELVKIDPATNDVVGSWTLPSGAAAVRAGLGSLWVTVSTTDQLLRIDPADPTSQTPIDVGAYPRFLAVGEDAVWVMNQRDGSVSRVAADGSVVATIKVSGPIDGGDIAVGGGSVWVQPGGDLLVRVDPATNEVSATYGPRSGSGSVAADDHAVWVSAHDVESIWRLPLP